MASHRRTTPPSGPQRWLTWYVGAGLAAFVAVTIGPKLVGRELLLAVSQLTTHYPWLAGGSKATGHQMCSGDTIDSQIPGTHFVLTSLSNGHLPNWQNLVAGGSPLASQPNLGLLNPMSWPYFVMPLWLAPAFIKLLVLIVAVSGTYLFLRRLSVRPAAALVAGITFAVSGFLVMWTTWPQSEVAACIPFLFWATERLVQRARLTDAIPVAIVVAAMLFGGFPAVTGWALYAAAAYLVVRVVALHRHEARRAWRRVALGAVGVVVGGLLSMVQMLPFAVAYTSTDFSYRDSLGTKPQPLSGLMTMFDPDANGLCIAGKNVYGRVNPIELVAYIGAAALVLIVVGAAARRKPDDETRGVRAYFTLSAALVLFLGWGTTAVLEIVDVLPVFNGNPIGRIRAVLGFLLAVLVGFGFDALQRKGYRRRQQDEPARSARAAALWKAVVILGAMGLAAGVGYYAVQEATQGGYRRHLLHSIEIPVLIGGIALVCVALAYLRRRPTTTLALLVLPGLVIGQGAVFFNKVLPGDSRANFYPVTPTHQFLKDHLGDARFAGVDGTMYAATSLYYGLRSATGHTFHEEEWIDLLMAVDSGVMRSATHSDFDPSLTPTLAGKSPILDRLSVKYLVVAPGLLVGDELPLTLGQGAVSGDQAACTLPAGPLRGVTFQLAQTLLAANAERGMALEVAVSAGGQTITSGRFLGTGVPAGVPISVAVPGEDLPPGQPVTVRITAARANGELSLVAGAGSQASGAACAPVRPSPDGLKLAFAEDGAIVYQRLTAMPRIRWASSATVIGDPVQRVTTLGRGAVPDDSVLLDKAGPPTSGKPATISVLADSGNTIKADVDAAGAGYLVIADALQQPGWSVTVDGKSAEIVAADHALAAVAIPAGLHHVSLSYHAPGQLTGAALTGVAIILMIGLGVAQRRRWFDGESPAGDESEPARETAPAASDLP